MPRPPKRHLPPHMRERVRKNKRDGERTYYFYDHGIGDDGKRRETPLGTDFAAALRQWSELHAAKVPAAQAIPPFVELCDRFAREVIPTKAPRTQDSYRANLVTLKQWFADVPSLETIRPMHLRQFLDKNRDRPIAANREKATFSTLWNHARAWGLTDATNPCEGIKGAREQRRETYIDDADFRAILQHAEPTLARTMRLMYLTGQRLGDVLKMRETDVRDGVLHVRQNKTKHALRIEVSGELAELIEEIKRAKAGSRVHSTALIVGPMNHPLKRGWLSKLWQRARDAAGLDKALQLRDVRAKAGTDVHDLNDAQRLLGHKSRDTTEIYRRNRDTIAPTSALRKGKKL